MVDSLHMKSVLGSQRGLTNAGCISSMAVRVRHRPCCCLAAGMPTGPAGRAFVEFGSIGRLVHPLRDTAIKASGSGVQNTQYNIMQDFLRMNLAHAPVSADGASLVVDHLTYQPAGAHEALLRDVSFSLPSNGLGLVYGRSGAGKTTLLQLLAGLTEPSSGTIQISTPGGGEQPEGGLVARERMGRAGIVFQFPERHFLGDDIFQELTFAWPLFGPDSLAAQQAKLLQLQKVVNSVGLADTPLETPLHQLSDGYKRRVALAVQLVRRPSLLLLDEPLAGLDWRSRAEVAGVLESLKKECTLLVVSHDLREITPMVDFAWKMEPGGTLNPSSI